MKTIAIIGGGAAGLAAAVAAGEAARAASDEVRVVVYEASDRVGRSILATGNGRCNFSNTRIRPETYHNGSFVEEVLNAFENAAFRRVASQARSESAAVHGVLGFFSDHGLMWREEGEGRLFPLANKATSVLDCLRAACAAANVECRTGCDVITVEAPRTPSGPFTLRLADGRFERAETVIVAVGGAIARRLLPEGVPWLKSEPILGPLACDSPWPRQLDNVRVRGALELWRPVEVAPTQGRYLDTLSRLGHRAEDHRAERLVSRETGEALFRKYGISGIAAFNLSRLVRPGDEVAVDFLPAVPANEAEAFLARRRNVLRSTLGRPVCWDDMLRGMVVAPVAHVLLAAAAIEADDDVTHEDLAPMAKALKGLRLPVTGLGDARQCQVHRGGVEVTAISEHSCELHQVPGLYVVGEAVDVDAPCGGYNLHWAWASGLLAGWNAVSPAPVVYGEGAPAPARHGRHVKVKLPTIEASFAEGATGGAVDGMADDLAGIPSVEPMGVSAAAVAEPGGADGPAEEFFAGYVEAILDEGDHSGHTQPLAHDPKQTQPIPASPRNTQPLAHDPEQTQPVSLGEREAGPEGLHE